MIHRVVIRLYRKSYLFKKAVVRGYIVAERDYVDKSRINNDSKGLSLIGIISVYYKIIR